MFLPTTREELQKLGWQQLDVIMVSGDTYVDTYYDGSAFIGKLLLAAGYKVGIIAQPSLDMSDDIMRLGEPSLFWGVSSGCVDSMVANYTALLKKKRSDDLTPGGVNNRRPDRAVIAYTNLIRKYFKRTVPIVLGGIEASLRRMAHYDYWSDSIRRSALLDSKADVLLYGMAEKAVLELAKALKTGNPWRQIGGLCYLSNNSDEDYVELPSYEEVKADKLKFVEMFHTFYKNSAVGSKGLQQRHGSRYVVQNPPQSLPTQDELDSYYELEFERDVHPFYKKQGKVKALDTVQFSVNSHRGCFGECNFCAITVHQGRQVQSRSEQSIEREVRKLIKHKSFKGNISDIGGPSANMYGTECRVGKDGSWLNCDTKRCACPTNCKYLAFDHSKQLRLLKRIASIEGIKKVFMASGLRYDLVLRDKRYGMEFLEEVVAEHTSGQLKIAPEHTENKVLEAMGKPTNEPPELFSEKFYELTKKHGKKQYLTYYLMAAHPGCEYADMLKLKRYFSSKQKAKPEQVQIFTPTPSTYSTLAYYTGLDPFTLKPIFVEKSLKGKRMQKEVMMEKKT